MKGSENSRVGWVLLYYSMVIMVGLVGIFGGWGKELAASGGSHKVISKAEREARTLLIKKCLYTEGLLDPHFEEQEKKERTLKYRIIRLVASGACGWVMAKILQAWFLGHTSIGYYYQAEKTKFLFQKNLHEGSRKALECAEMFHECLDGVQEMVAGGQALCPSIHAEAAHSGRAGEVVAGGSSGRVPEALEVFTGVVIPEGARNSSLEKSWEKHKKNAAGVKQGLFLLLWAGTSVLAYYMIKYGREKLSRPYTKLLNDLIDHWFEHRVGVPDFLVQEGDVLRALRDLHGGELDEETAQEIVMWWAEQCLEARLDGS